MSNCCKCGNVGRGTSAQVSHNVGILEIRLTYVPWRLVQIPYNSRNVKLKVLFTNQFVGSCVPESRPNRPRCFGFFSTRKVIRGHEQKKTFKWIHVSFHLSVFSSDCLWFCVALFALAFRLRDFIAIQFYKSCNNNFTDTKLKQNGST